MKVSRSAIDRSRNWHNLQKNAMVGPRKGQDTDSGEGGDKPIQDEIVDTAQTILNWEKAIAEYGLGEKPILPKGAGGGGTPKKPAPVNPNGRGTSSTEFAFKAGIKGTPEYNMAQRNKLWAALRRTGTTMGRMSGSR